MSGGMHINPVEEIIIEVFNNSQSKNGWISVKDGQKWLKEKRNEVLKKFGVPTISQPFVSRKFNDLLKKGILDRYPHKGHGRSVVYHLKER